MRFILVILLFLMSVPAVWAQDTNMNDGTQILGTVQITEPTGENIQDFDDQNGEKDTYDGVVIDPDFLSDDSKSYDAYNKVVIRILDKVTAESRTYDLNIDKTVAFGSLRIRPKTCQKTPPIEEPESASFLQIWEKTPEANDQWVFSGWMFASSPSLSAMEHPVYDVWVIDCKDPQAQADN